MKKQCVKFALCIFICVPSRHKTLNQCCFTVGPPSTTLDQRKGSIDSTFCVCWVIYADSIAAMKTVDFFQYINFIYMFTIVQIANLNKSGDAV